MGSRSEIDDWRLRQQVEDQAEREARERDRRGDFAPAVLRTPREEVEAYVRAAAECLRGPVDSWPSRVAGALRWLDEALAVVRSPEVVDGALLVRGAVLEAVDAANEGSLSRTVELLEDALELLRRQVRPVPGDDGVFTMPPLLATPEQVCKRAAVRSVLKRHELTLGGLGTSVLRGVGTGVLPDGMVDELIAAAETGI